MVRKDTVFAIEGETVARRNGELKVLAMDDSRDTLIGGQNLATTEAVLLTAT